MILNSAHIQLVNGVILKSLKISTNCCVFKKEVLIFFQGFFLQNLKGGVKSSNEHQKLKENERMRKNCFSKCQELIYMSFRDWKKNCDPYSKSCIELLCSYLGKFDHIIVGRVGLWIIMLKMWMRKKNLNSIYSKKLVTRTINSAVLSFLQVVCLGPVPTGNCKSNCLLFWTFLAALRPPEWLRHEHVPKSLDVSG